MSFHSSARTMEEMHSLQNRNKKTQGQPEHVRIRFRSTTLLHIHIHAFTAQGGVEVFVVFLLFKCSLDNQNQNVSAIIKLWPLQATKQN